MQLNFKQYGSAGEPIVILHGIFGSLDNWHTVAKELSENYTVYTLDLRNHGHSPHSEEMSLALMAEDVHTFILEHSLEKVHLVGHSMGGKVAMLFAQSYVSQLKSLVVVDIAPKTYKSGHLPYFKAYQEINLSRINNRKELDDAFAEYESNMAVRQFLMKNIVSGANGYHLKINVQAIEKAYSEIIGGIHLGKINIPTLFMAGKKSNYIREADKESIKQIFSQVQFTSISNAGHWVHAENRPSFIRALTEFIQDI